jgi:alkanesulfonate monooxygenase SsuD/methylene tetrahydromethanopterin reductase-like flavin-dependent oxidoreductase (luciferase family)
MKLGLMLGYSGAEMSLPVELVQRAETLGFDSVWTAEAYGSDATSPLAYLAAVTKRIRLGTSIMQLAGRTPAMAAMQAATIDALAGGDRFIAGLGVSGPQIVEGWYGQPWGKPYWRIRDYVAIMRKVFAREEGLTHQGKEISLPYRGEGAMGIGKPYPLGLGDLANELGVSRRTVHYAFRKALGVTPYQFILHRKLVATRRHLREEGHSDWIREVALQHGFRHAGRFSQQYAQLFNELPSTTVQGQAGSTHRKDAVLSR